MRVSSCMTISPTHKKRCDSSRRCYKEKGKTRLSKTVIRKAKICDLTKHVALEQTGEKRCTQKLIVFLSFFFIYVKVLLEKEKRKTHNKMCTNPFQRIQITKKESQ
jgi:hypothetical protein